MTDNQDDKTAVDACNEAWGYATPYGRFISHHSLSVDRERDIFAAGFAAAEAYWRAAEREDVISLIKGLSDNECGRISIVSAIRSRRVTERSNDEVS